MQNLITEVFEEHREQNKHIVLSEHKNKEETIKKLQNEMEQIEHTLVRTKIPKLYEKLEEERAHIDQKKTKLSDNLSKEVDSGQKMKELLEKTKLLFSNPKKLWNKSSPSLRKVLLKVRF